MEKKKRSPLALILCLIYLLQVVLVCYWEFTPLESRDQGGIRHEIRKGFGFPWALIPGYGLLPTIAPSFQLIKTDLATEKQEKKSFSTVNKIYAENAEVWPEKQASAP